MGLPKSKRPKIKNKPTTPGTHSPASLAYFWTLGQWETLSQHKVGGTWEWQTRLPAGLHMQMHTHENMHTHLRTSTQRRQWASHVYLPEKNLFSLERQLLLNKPPVRDNYLFSYFHPCPWSIYKGVRVGLTVHHTHCVPLSLIGSCLWFLKRRLWVPKPLLSLTNILVVWESSWALRARLPFASLKHHDFIIVTPGFMKWKDREIDAHPLKHKDTNYPWVNNSLVYRAKGDKARSQVSEIKCVYL